MNSVTFDVNKEYFCDVLVVGGGVAGVSAAVAAARRNVKVILIESGGYLGGTATKGLVGPFMTCYDSKGENKIIKGIFGEVVDKLVEIGGGIKSEDCLEISSKLGYREKGHKGVTPFRVEALKSVLETLCVEAGVKLLYHSMLVGCDCDDRKIKSVYFASVSGIGKISSKQFIDCTGNSGLGAYSGAKILRGDEDGNVQTASMFFTVSGVNKEMLDKHSFSAKDDREKYYMDIIEAHKEDGTFPCGTRKIRAFEGLCGEWFINMCQEDSEVNELDVECVTNAEISQRAQISKMIDFLKKYIPPFKNISLIDTASEIGIRESRRIEGIYRFCVDDILSHKKFDDRIAVCSNSIDIHCKDRVNYTPHDGENYYIPLSCLISKDVDNLTFAGKNISADKFAFAAVRVMPPCFAMGEAVGYTSASAAIDNINPKDVDIKKIQSLILLNGGYIG